MRPGKSCTGQPREETCLATHFRLVAAEVSVRVRQSLQANGELDVARADNILDLELLELGLEPELLDDSRVLARGKPRVVLRLGTRDDHLARRENERRRLGLTDAHDDRRESLQGSAGQRE